MPLDIIFSINVPKGTPLRPDRLCRSRSNSTRLCALSYWTMLEYHAPNFFTTTFFKKSRDMSIFQAIKLENRQGGIPRVGGRLKPVKSTFFWTGGCADLSIYSLKNQTFHPFSLISPLLKSPLSHLNFLVFIHNYVLVLHSKLIYPSYVLAFIQLKHPIYPIPLLLDQVIKNLLKTRFLSIYLNTP